jgi:ketosteroid isomerase-like protein
VRCPGCEAVLQWLEADWIGAFRRGDIDAIAERFHADVAWVDVAGGVACKGREQVLAWLRVAPELLADAEHSEQADRRGLVAGTSKS